MGTGRLNGSRFDLTLSLQHSFIANRIPQWEKAFRRASELLFDATDGQHQLGTISVCPNGLGTHEADFYLNPGGGQSESSQGMLDKASFHATLCSDERFRPFIILHEFAHYAYDLYDEYKGPKTDKAACVIRAGDACIMEGRAVDGDRFGAGIEPGGPLVVGRLSEFCVPGNHDKDQDTDQDFFHKHQSCWTTMVARYPDTLTAPVGQPTTQVPGGAMAITWTVLAAVQRFALVLDRSAAVAGPLLGEEKIGAAWWADAAVVGDQLGVVSFDDTATTDVPLTTITDDGDRAAVRSVVADLQAGGAGTLGAGRELLRELTLNPTRGYQPLDRRTGPQKQQP